MSFLFARSYKKCVVNLKLLRQWMEGICWRGFWTVNAKKYHKNTLKIQNICATLLIVF